MSTLFITFLMVAALLFVFGGAMICISAVMLGARMERRHNDYWLQQRMEREPRR